MQVATSTVVGWVILASLVGAVIFLAAWFKFRYTPWKRKLWEKHVEFSPEQRGEGIQPDPFPGGNEMPPEEVDKWWTQSSDDPHAQEDE